MMYMSLECAIRRQVDRCNREGVGPTTQRVHTRPGLSVRPQEVGTHCDDSRPIRSVKIQS